MSYLDIREKFGKKYEWNVFVPLTAIFAVANGVELDFSSKGTVLPKDENGTLKGLIEALNRYDTKGDSLSRFSSIYHDLSAEAVQNSSFAGYLKESFTAFAQSIIANSPFSEGRTLPKEDPMFYYGLHGDDYSYFMPFFSVDDIGLKMESPGQTFLGVTQVKDLDLIFNAVHYGEENVRVIYGDVASVWPEQHYSVVLSSLPANLPHEDMRHFFALLLENRTKSEYAHIWINGDCSIVSESRAMESLRSSLTECGFLEQISILNEDRMFLSFNLMEKRDYIDSGSRDIPIATMRANHYLWNSNFYHIPPRWFLKQHADYAVPTDSEIVSMDHLADLFVGLNEDEEECLKNEYPELYDRLYYDETIVYDDYVETLIPVVSCYLSEVVRTDREKLSWKEIMDVETDDIFIGPCVLAFTDSNRHNSDIPTAIVRREGIFILSEETVRKYGRPLCFIPSAKISVEYLAYALMNDRLWSEIISSKKAFREYGTEILSIVFCEDPDLRQRMVSERVSYDEKAMVYQRTANIAWVGDHASYTEELQNAFAHMNLHVSSEFLADTFSKSDLLRQNERVETHLDAIVISSYGIENLARLRDIVIQDDVKHIPCFLYLPADETNSETFRFLFREWSSEGKVILLDERSSEFKLADAIRTTLNAMSDEKSSLSEVYLRELTEADLIDGGSASRILLEALADNRTGDYIGMRNTEEHFNTLRTILERLFRICSGSGFLPDINIGAMASLLYEGAYFDRHTKCGYVYRNGNNPMPSALACSLRYLVDILNGGSHAAGDDGRIINLREYVSYTGSDHLFKSAVHILMDVVRWYQNLNEYQRMPGFESVNLYEYDGIVRIDEDGIPHCGYIKLNDKGLKEGMRVQIFGAACNKDDRRYPLYSKEFKII